MSIQVNLSIIIPVYNVVKYLPGCIGSACAVNIPNKEILCIDDGSTDGSVDILREYATQNPCIKIFQQQHGGASAARNKGIDLAIGEYIFFLDSDDYIAYPDHLEHVFNQTTNSQADIGFFNATINGTTRYMETMPECKGVVSGKELMRLFYINNRTVPTPVWMQIYRREYLLSSGIRQKVGSMHEDELFTPIVLYNAKKAVCFDEPVVYYRMERPGAVTTQYGEKYFSDWVNIGRDLFDYFSNIEATEDSVYRQIFGVYIQILDALLLHKENPRRYLSRSDYKSMESCCRTSYEKKCYKLSCISHTLLIHYRNNTLPAILRKAINRFL